MGALALLIPALAPLFNKVLDLIPDSNARAKAEMELNNKLLELVAEEGKDQRSINAEEAKHRSVFVAGWRPFIGWVCGLAFAFAFVIRPLVVWAVLTFKPELIGNIPDFPMDYLMELLCAMLGIGSLRTFEKIKKVA